MVLVISLHQPINPLTTVVVSPRGRVSRDKICNIVTCLFPFVNEKKITGNSTKEKPCLANGKLIAAAPPPKPWKLQHMQLQHNPLFQLWLSMQTHSCSKKNRSTGDVPSPPNLATPCHVCQVLCHDTHKNIHTLYSLLKGAPWTEICI